MVADLRLESPTKIHSEMQPMHCSRLLWNILPFSPFVAQFGAESKSNVTEVQQQTAGISIKGGVPRSTFATPRPTSTPRPRAFIMLPLCWKDRLATTAQPSTFKLAHHLIYVCWKTAERSIRLSNTVAAAMGISRRSTVALPCSRESQRRLWSPRRSQCG
jgi:hypothetical protein